MTQSMVTAYSVRFWVQNIPSSIFKASAISNLLEFIIFQRSSVACSGLPGRKPYTSHQEYIIRGYELLVPPRVLTIVKGFLTCSAVYNTGKSTVM